MVILCDERIVVNLPSDKVWTVEFEEVVQEQALVVLRQEGVDITLCRGEFSKCYEFFERLALVLGAADLSVMGDLPF